MKVKKVAVGSNNPVKIDAVKEAVERLMGGGVEVKGLKVKSGVSDQPMTDVETEKGAKARAMGALKEGKVDLGVGFEGGVFLKGDEVWNTVWCAVVDKTGKMEVTNGSRFRVPKKLAEKILAGDEMGPAMDELVGENNIKQKQGMLGVITGGRVTRKEAYVNLIVLALSRWMTEEWE